MLQFTNLYFILSFDLMSLPCTEKNMIYKITVQKTTQKYSEAIPYVCLFGSLHSYTFTENCEVKVTKACRNKEQSTLRKNPICVVWQSEERLYRPKVSLY